MLLLGTKYDETAGPSTTVDCLWCGKQATTATARERSEWLMLAHLVPIFRMRTVFVRCDTCAKDMIAKCSMDEIARGNPMTLREFLVKRVSFVGKVCIVLGLLFCWAPFVGLILNVIGFLNRNAYGAVLKAMSYTGLILSLLSTALGIVGAVLSKH